MTIVDSSWSDDRIIDFLKQFWGCDEFVFDCEISDTPISTPTPEKYKGAVSNIRYNGKLIKYPNNKHGIFTNIPNTIRQNLPVGQCKLRFSLLKRESRERSGNLCLITPEYDSFRELNPDANPIAPIVDEAIEEVITRLRLRSRLYMIGQFVPIGDNWSVLDLRYDDFTKIEDKERGIRNLSIRVRADRVHDINKFAYYKFGWEILSADPLRFGIDFQKGIKQISPRDIVQCLYDRIYNYPPSASRQITSILDTLRKQLTQNGKEVFIYELLQNANDYPRKVNGVVQPVEVEFHITNDFLIFEHSGDYFNAKNIAAICDINDGEKTENVDAIGYKGIGFKTVFLDNDYVYLRSGTYSFRFENNPKYPINTPWQILPVWTSRDELEGNIINIFSRTSDQDFRVKFALRPRDPKILTDYTYSGNYYKLFQQVFETERVILFIPNISKVNIYYGNNLDPAIVRKADSEHWCVSPAMKDDIPEEITKRINEVLTHGVAKSNGYDKVPEKYKDFKRTSVKFACLKKGHELLPVDDAHLYCYLPAKKADWGFKFLMNTDMVPNGERDDIENIELNHVIAKIAGQQFFYWIQELIKSGEYNWDSIFNLIPNFDECIKLKSGYKEFIEEFRDGFKELLDSKPLIPIMLDGKLDYAKVDDITYDTTGLSCSGMMSDEQILKFCEWKDYFPHPTLRDYANATLKPAFGKFLATYHSEEQEFDIKVLKESVKNKEFQAWLKEQENNNNFLRLLVSKPLIHEFTDSQIFIANDGSLHAPNVLFYDVDEYYDEISYFESYLSHLCVETRKQFDHNVIWEAFSNSFRHFEPNQFVNSELLCSTNFSDVHDILSSSTENAFNFMHFLAKYVDYKSTFRNFPFVDEDGSIVKNCFNHAFTYLPNQEILELRDKPWVYSSYIAIFSSKYDDLSAEYFRENFGVLEFSTQTFIEQYVCSGKYADAINELIEDWEINKEFNNYLFAHQDSIPDGKLAPYKVACINKSGEESYNIITENYLCLLDSKEGIRYETLPWVDDSMLDVVHDDYFTVDNRVKLTQFFEKKYGIPVLNLDSYVNEILERQTADINSYLKDKQINLAFWRWTKEHYEEREKLDPIFAKFYVLAKTLDEESLDFHNIDENIFLSSSYQKSDDAEKIVTMFAQNTLFISPYMEKSNEKVKDWVDFWRKIGVKTTIEDLVFEKVIPHLDEIREDGLPNLLGEYYSQIKERWDDVKDALCKIRVKTRRDGFYNIHDAVVINVSKEKEPFKDIIISNEIDPAIIGNKNTRELLLNIAEYANAWMVNNMTDWQQYKVSNYVSNEDEYGEEIHMAFIKELALIDVETIKSFNHVDYLRLLARNGEYISPSLLTLGSLYKPECDFEKFGVECQYVSDNYYSAEAAEALVTLIRKGIFDVHYSFTSDDIESLSSYDFALYFWKDYAWSHSAEVSEWIENDLFGGVECVPTMAKTIDTPNNLYSRDISEYVVKGINKWEAKLPSDQIPKPKEGSFDMFAKLPFKDHLSFNDGIEALINIKNVGKRATILTWLRDEYTDDKEDLITAYRKDKDALWRNGKGKEVPLTELYALAPESTMLFDYFQDNEYVLPHGYLHDLTEEDYRGICSMMQIPIVEEKDMEFTPFDSVKENLGHYFEGKLLIFAAIDNPKNWTKSFANYKEKLSDLTFWKCSKIAWVYGKNEAVQQSNRKFFCQDNRFFYVGTWSGFQVSRFFLDALEDHIGLTLHRNEELFLRIMDPAAEMQELLEDYHSIKTEEFIVELNKYSSYQPEVIQIEEDDDDVYSSGYRPRTFDPELQREQTSPDYDNPYEDEDNELQYEDVDTPTDDSPRPARETNPIRATERRRPEHVEHPRVQPKQVEVAHDGTYSGSDAPEEKNPISNTPRRPHAPAEPGERRAMNGSSHSPREPYSPNPDAIKSEGIPVELATLEMGVAEEADLRRILNGMSSDAIANNAYLANYRLFKQIENWKQEHPEYDIEPEESEADFIRNIPKEGGVISDHRLKNGKFMRACSAARGVLYLSPGIWNMVADNRCVLCIYRGADNNRVANEFLLIKSYDELLQFIGHDDLLVKITGEHRVKIIEFLYNNLNSKVTRGTVYSLIRVAESTPINSAMASVSAAMTEQEDEDSKFYDL